MQGVLDTSALQHRPRPTHPRHREARARAFLCPASGETIWRSGGRCPQGTRAPPHDGFPGQGSQVWGDFGSGFERRCEEVESAASHASAWRSPNSGSVRVGWATLVPAGGRPATGIAAPSAAQSASMKRVMSPSDRVQSMAVQDPLGARDSTARRLRIREMTHGASHATSRTVHVISRCWNSIIWASLVGSHEQDPCPASETLRGRVCPRAATIRAVFPAPWEDPGTPGRAGEPPREWVCRRHGSRGRHAAHDLDGRGAPALRGDAENARANPGGSPASFRFPSPSASAWRPCRSRRHRA